MREKNIAYVIRCLRDGMRVSFWMVGNTRGGISLLEIAG